jgi:hypothetical protein
MQFSTITLVAAIAGTTFAAPHDLEPRIDCSSAACQTLVDEASCFIDAGANIIKIFQCLDAAGGVSSVSANATPLRLP